MAKKKGKKKKNTANKFLTSFGLTPKQIKKLRKQFRQEADQEFKPEFDFLDSEKLKAETRAEEDLQTEVEDQQTSLTELQEDIAEQERIAREQTGFSQAELQAQQFRAQELADTQTGRLAEQESQFLEDIAAQQAAQALQQQIQTEGQVTSLNQQGKFGSGRQQLEQGRLAAEQGRAQQALENQSTRGLSGIQNQAADIQSQLAFQQGGFGRQGDRLTAQQANQLAGFQTQLGRGTSRINRSIGLLERNTNRGLIDVRDAFSQDQRNLRKQRKQRVGGLLGSEIDFLSGQAQTARANRDVGQQFSQGINDSLLSTYQ